MVRYGWQQVFLRPCAISIANIRLKNETAKKYLKKHNELLLVRKFFVFLRRFKKLFNILLYKIKRSGDKEKDSVVLQSMRI